MFNFVCHYKATAHFSSDELVKNSSTYDVLATVCNYLTFKSTIRNDITKIQQHTHCYKWTLKPLLLNLGSSIYIYVDYVSVRIGWYTT
jgi:hypothetical protein